MGATEPRQVIELFIKFFNSGDIDSLINTLYEPNVIFVPEPKPQSVSGAGAVRAVIQSFMAPGATMSLVSSVTFQNGDIALVHSRWRIAIPGAAPAEGVSAEVVRRQGDGTWKYAIDNPWGTAVVGPSSP